MQLLTIGKNQAGQRLDKFLKKALPNAGTGFLYKMLQKQVTKLWYSTLPENEKK